MASHAGDKALDQLRKLMHALSDRPPTPPFQEPHNTPLIELEVLERFVALALNRLLPSSFDAKFQRKNQESPPPRKILGGFVEAVVVKTSDEVQVVYPIRKLRIGSGRHFDPTCHPFRKRPACLLGLLESDSTGERH